MQIENFAKMSTAESERRRAKSSSFYDPKLPINRRRHRLHHISERENIFIQIKNFKNTRVKIFFATVEKCLKTIFRRYVIFRSYLLRIDSKFLINALRIFFKYIKNDGTNGSEF